MYFVYSACVLKCRIRVNLCPAYSDMLLCPNTVQCYHIIVYYVF